MRRRRPEKNMPGRCPWHIRNFSTGSVSIDTVWSAHHTDFAMGEIGMAAMRANHVGAVLQVDAGRSTCHMRGDPVAKSRRNPLVGVPDPSGQNAMTGTVF